MKIMGEESTTIMPENNNSILSLGLNSYAGNIGTLNVDGQCKEATSKLSLESPFSINITPSLSTFGQFFSDDFSELDTNPKIDEMERKLHLAFLFSGPLVTAYKDQNQIKIKPMPTLEYQKEIEQIARNAGEFSQGIKYKKCIATLDNFQRCLNEMPVALHFAGHGMKNTAFGTESIYDGDFLVFEDEFGKAQYVSCKILKEILRTCPRQPEFVFVSSCHSRLVGDVFKAAGAKHVICVKRSEKVLDEVAVLFAQEFYKVFFLQHGTVCDAFEVAKTKVMAKTAEHVDHTPYLTQGTEHTKFELLIGGDYSLMPHSCLNTYLIPVGKPVEIAQEVKYKEIPSKVEYFVGRKCDLYNIICLIKNSRIVTIKGLAGIGKTSMAKTLANFFMERGIFSDGIIYISARGLESTEALITQLYITAKAETDGVKDKMTKIFNVLRNSQVLLIIDNAEDPLNKDKTQFLGMIQTMLNQLPNLKILVTSRTQLGSLPDLTEKVYNLLPLDPKSSVLLLEKRAPRQISSGEVDDLFHEQGSSSSNISDINSRFEEHKLMQLLAGHPQAISLAAALLQGRTLKEIYHELMSSSLRVNEMHSLKLSLSLSIEHVKLRNPDSVRFFRMMGLFPSGACSEAMNEIWGSGYKDHVDNLQYVSLLVRKEVGDLQEDKYLLLQFVADYAMNYLKTYDITEEFERGCNYYAEKCEAAFMNDTNKSEVIIGDEPNILAFLAYASENRAIENLEEEESNTVQEDCKLVIENLDKDLVPSREAVEMLDAEESRLNRMVRHNNSRLLERRNLKSANEYKRADSEETPSLNSVTIQLEKLRRISVYVSREIDQSNQCSSSNNSVDHDRSFNIGTDEEFIPIKKRKSEEAIRVKMGTFGRLLVYYCANLLLAQRYNDANKIILNNLNSSNIVSDTLAQANLYKMLGIINDKLQNQKPQKDFSTSIKYYSKARRLFSKFGSCLGQACCFVALGEIEKQEDEYEKAKRSYENALRNYNLIKHSYGIALSHCALSLIKDKLEQKNTANKAIPPIKLAREVKSNGKKKYNGGTFVSRWEGGPGAFIIEVAKVKGNVKELVNRISSRG